MLLIFNLKYELKDVVECNIILIQINLNLHLSLICISFTFEFG